MSEARRREPAAIPWISGDDITMLARLPVGALIAWLLPEAAWGRFANAVARRRRGSDERVLGRLEGIVGSHRLAQPLPVAFEAHVANIRLAQLQTLRLQGLGAGWRPTVRLEGRTHVEEALLRGRGVILWIAPFVFASLIAKMTFHREGFAVSHLSRYSHGYSKSRFGARLLNPVRTRVEDRHLAERIVIGPDQSTLRPMRTLAKRLSENRIVSITIAAQGAKPLPAPFLNASVRVASGAANLMLRTGAALLPVFTVREPDGAFVTLIEPPLRPSEGASGDEALVAVIAQLARTLETYVIRWPDQFLWRYDILGGRRSVQGA